jgi:hypothetical protein
MNTRIDKHQWEVRAAYRLGWEVRVSCYERLLRSIIMMLEDVQNLMKVDDMPDAIRNLGRVLIELEDTLAMVNLRKTEELAGRRLPERAGHDRNGAS